MHQHPYYRFNRLKYRTAKNLSYCGIAAVIYFVILSLPLPHFTEPAIKTLGVFGVATFFWVTSVFSIAFTGLIVIFLLPLTGAIDAPTTYSYFGNSAVFFVLGAFILASPVMRSGLSTRVAVNLISKFGRGKKRLLLSIFTLSALLAFIISEHAVAAMLYPIVLEIIQAAGLKPGDRYSFAAFLAMGWGAATGGTATLLGGARAPLALGMLNSHTDFNIGFVEWSTYTLPIVFIVCTMAFLIIVWVADRSDACINAARAQLELHHTTMGPLSKREIITMLILIVTIVLWITAGSHFGLESIALFGVGLAFIFGITRWKEVEEDVQWGIFIMYGGAIALGAALKDSGAANALVDIIMGFGIASPFLIFTMMVLLSFILTEAMSNAASVAVLMPIALALCPEYSIDPRAMTVGIATAAGLTYMLPVSTPAIAIIVSSEYIDSMQAFKWGTLIKTLSFFVLLGVAALMWPLYL